MLCFIGVGVYSRRASLREDGEARGPQNLVVQATASPEGLKSAMLPDGSAP